MLGHLSSLCLPLAGGADVLRMLRDLSLLPMMRRQRELPDGDLTTDTASFGHVGVRCRHGKTGGVSGPRTCDMFVAGFSGLGFAMLIGSL